MKQLIAGIAVGAAGVWLFGPGAPTAAVAGIDRANAAQVTSTSACSRTEEARNKALVASLQPGSPQFHAVLAPDYVQHAPEYARFAQINGVSDRQAVRLIEQAHVGKTARRLAPPAPGQPRPNPAYKVIAECDMIVAVVQHWEPVPGDPGKFYAAYFFNMWRIKDGKLAEHWDADELPSPLPDYLKLPVATAARAQP